MTLKMLSHNLAIYCDEPVDTPQIELIESVATAFPEWHFIIIDGSTIHPESSSSPLANASTESVHVGSSHSPEVIAEPSSSTLEMGARFPKPLPRSLSRLNQHNVEYHRVSALDDPQVVRLIRELEPWAAIDLRQTQATPREILNVPRCGTLLVETRFAPNARHEADDHAFKAKSSNASIVVSRIRPDGDELDVVLQGVLPDHAFSTPRGVALRLELLAIDTLIQSLRELDLSTDRATRIDDRTPPCATLSMDPMRREDRALTAGQGASSAGHRIERWLKATYKRVILTQYVYGYARIRNFIRWIRRRSHATVLVYHRVSDEFQDGITVGIEQFENQLKLLRRDHDIVDLPELFASRSTARKRPCVAITFDDGYADNRLAALILRRFGIPCTFFVSTRIVGSTNPFPHDMARLGRHVATLSSSDISMMSGWGFHFGNHTASHANLAQIPVALAIQEIETGRSDLQRMHGESVASQWLAYPFGGRGDLTEAVHSELPGLGITACLSAFGGTNPPPCDPMRVCRQGVNYQYSLLHFRASIEGWIF